MSLSAFNSKAQPPTMEEVFAVVGAKRPFWELLSRFVADSYGVEGAFKSYGKSYGWMLWFRRSGKTLLALYPLQEGVAAQIILGPSQVEAADQLPLGDNVRRQIAEAHPYPEGRWVFVQLQSPRDVEDIKSLLLLKSPPPKRPLRRGGDPRED